MAVRPLGPGMRPGKPEIPGRLRCRSRFTAMDHRRISCPACSGRAVRDPCMRPLDTAGPGAGAAPWGNSRTAATVVRCDAVGARHYRPWAAMPNPLAQRPRQSNEKFARTKAAAEAVDHATHIKSLGGAIPSLQLPCRKDFAIR